MGAPKGNKNALKHGIYSRFIAVVDDEEMADMSVDHTLDEIAYARAMLKDASSRRSNASDNEERLKWDYACRHWIEIISERIERKVQKGSVEREIFETLLDAVRAANDRQNVRR